MTDREFYTVAEAAALLRVSDQTVRRLISAGRIAAVLVGRQVRIPVDGVRDGLPPAGQAVIRRPLRHLRLPG